MNPHDASLTNAERKAILFYSLETGRSKSKKRIEKAIAELTPVFAKLDTYQIVDMDEMAAKINEIAENYEVLLVFGGDGTMQHILSCLAQMENPPILGYIPGGTLNDFGTNFGLGHSYKRGIKAIQDGNVTGFDVGRINDQYFGYCAAVGAFADISYVASRGMKKKWGRLSYYLLAIKEAFHKQKVEGTLRIDGKEIPFCTPFLLCLSGRNMAGFPVSRKSKVDDGLFELYITKPGLFNGLLHYLFFKAKTDCYVASSFKIETKSPLFWELDGEKGPSGNVEISCLPKKLKIFSL